MSTCWRRHALTLGILFALMAGTIPVQVNAEINNVTDPLDVTSSQVQTASNNLVFFLQPAGNCLAVPNDLSSSMASKNLAALWIRAVFHDGATFNISESADDNQGALDGSLINELDRTVDNAGFGNSIADRFMGLTTLGDEVLSVPDAITLAGIISIKHCGGPQVNFRLGRDNISPGTGTNAENRIPEADQTVEEVAEMFARMGFTIEEMVTLTTGSHTMGGVHSANSPQFTNETYVPFDSTPGVFDNDVFKQVLSGYCALPIDCNFAKNDTLRALMQRYADDQDYFFQEYAIAFEKLTNRTWSDLGDVTSISIPVHTNLVSEGTSGGAPSVNGTGSSDDANSGGFSLIQGSSNCIFKNILTNVGTGFVSSSAALGAVIAAMLGAAV